ncbi:hypothetical protein [Crenothrix polyspora]|uniref:Uncharacterized protein n=1 Tax=Crenothrix polyspora TaxID=360316 RepID=A0A1R4HDJ4_9GAMM|nr:hypothetical protein [Crenothrix polyspora]SJM94318.1 exported hypothetical protein [Crenothrix polyspora]
MKKKLLVTAIAVASAVVGTSAMAASTFGNPGQLGSLLVFPRIEAETQNFAPSVATGTGVLATTTDTLVHLTNDGPNDVAVQCYWNTTSQIYTGKGGNTGTNTVLNTGTNPTTIDPATGVVTPASSLNSTPAERMAARAALREQHAQGFELVLKKGRTHSFWAGDLSGLANGAYIALGNKLSTIENVPQFNFFPDGSQSNVGDLKCFAKQNGKEAKFNFLTGKATVFTFNDPLSVPGPGTGLPTAATLGQAHEYNAWSFQRLAAAGAPGELKLDGKEYDICPMALTGSYIPSAHPFASFGPGVPNVTQVSLSSCNQNLEENGAANISLLKYTVVDSAGNKRSAGYECMGAWAEADLGDKFHAFTYGALKADQASFRIQAGARSRLCNVDQAAAFVNKTDLRPTPGAIEADVVESGLVGIQVTDVGGAWQTSSSLTGVDVTAASASGYYNSKLQVNSFKY